jgi:hypothetical protein
MEEHILDLWKQVFVAAIRAGCGAYDAANKANYAVELFEAKFKKL